MTTHAWLFILGKPDFKRFLGTDDISLPIEISDGKQSSFLLIVLYEGTSFGLFGLVSHDMHLFYLTELPEEILQVLFSGWGGPDWDASHE